MTDQITPESGAEQVSGELPTPTFTDASPASAPSTVDADSLAAKVAEILRPTIERTVQSVKDKRFADIQKQLGRADLEDVGVQLTPEQELRLQVRELQRYVQQQTPVQAVSQASGTTQDSDRVSQVIKEYGLDGNRPEVIKLLSGQYRNFDHFQAEAGKLAVKQHLAAPPDTSAAPSMGGGGSPRSLTPEQREEISGQIVALSSEPTKNAAQIKALREQLKG